MPPKRSRPATLASLGPAVDGATANAAPILDTAAPSLGPQVVPYTDPGLPPELQPQPGDVLLAQGVWPWDDLGAKLVPEHWLYMSRRVQGTVALLTVQTANGPKLVKANPDGTIVQAPSPTATILPYYAGSRGDTTQYTQRQPIPFVALNAAALAAASTTLLVGITPVDVYILKKITISSSVAVANKVAILDNLTQIHNVILPANAMPYDYEWPGQGYLSSSRWLYFYTDNAGTFSVTINYLARPN